MTISPPRDRSLGLALILPALIWSCRDGVDACGDGVCDRAQASGDAGAAGLGGRPREADGGSGQGGAAEDARDPDSAAGVGAEPEPDPEELEPDPEEPEVDPAECSRDSECDDARACTGAERCDNGRCSSGEALVCSNGTECVERADGPRCEYTGYSPWLMFTGDEAGMGYFGLFAVRSVDIGTLPPRNLTEQIPSSDFLGVGWAWWSPNGRYLLLDSMRPNFSNRVFFIKFGPSGPEPARPVPDLPSIGEWWGEDWSRDSRVALVLDGTTDELYRIDFSGPEPVPALLGEVEDAVFCAESDVVYELASGDVYIRDRDWDSPPELVGPGSFAVSPGRRWLLFESDSELWLSQCRHFYLRGPTEIYTETFEWSHDGAYFVAGGGDGLSVFDTEQASLVWSAEASEWRTFWAEDAARLLVRGLSGSEEGSGWSVLDFPGAARTDLPISDEASAEWMGEHVVYTRVDASGEVESGFFERGSGEAIPLGRCNTSFASSPDGRFVACLWREDEQADHLLAFELQGGTAVPLELAVPEYGFETLRLEGFSSDGLGLVVQQHFLYADEDRGGLLWLPTVDALSGTFVPISQGKFAYKIGRDLWRPAGLL